MATHRPPHPATHPDPVEVPRRDPVTSRHLTQLEAVCLDAGVPVAPWVAWLREAATLYGADEAAERAALGATVEPAWCLQPGDVHAVPVVPERRGVGGWLDRRSQARRP